MTLKELISRVQTLSGEDAYAEVGTVLNAVNLALGRIYTEVGIVGKGSVLVQSPRTQRVIKEIRHAPGKKDEFTLSGVAYSFCAYGRGTLTVKDGDAQRTEVFDGYGVKMRGLIRVGGTVSFEGELAFCIKNFVTFKELLASSADGIHVWSEGQRIPLEHIAGDISRVIGTPTDRYGRTFDGVFFEGNTLVADAAFTGEVFFKYNKRPPILSEDNDSRDLGLPSEIESALVNLSAAYLVAVTEPEAAEFFEAEYEKLRRSLKGNEVHSRFDRYINTARWA